MTYDSEGKEIKIEATLEETDKKCPMCGGVMNYDPDTGGLRCPFCDYKQEIDEKDIAEEQDFDKAEETGNCNWGMETKVVICKSCGASTVYDAMQTSGECPYCGSNQVMEARGEHTIAPNGVVPFKVSAKEASDKFSAWIKKKFFAPKAVKTGTKTEKFKGFYLPYWTFDSDTITNYAGRYGIDHTYKDSKGNTHTSTSWYPTSGVYVKFFDDVLVLATDRHNTKILNKIQPFDTGSSVEYDPEYITGFVSERYTKGIKDAWGDASARIEKQIHRDILNKIRSEHFADHAEITFKKVAYNNKKYKYLMLPVWTSSFKYNGKIYYFNVNGQTGKVGGKAPVSPFKIILTVLLGLLALAFVFWFISH